MEYFCCEVGYVVGEMFVELRGLLDVLVISCGFFLKVIKIYCEFVKNVIIICFWRFFEQF